MDPEPDSPVAGRAEEHSGSLLLTYFQGDINSMVDAHFSRALRNIYKPKADTVKGKRNRKSAKSEEPSSSSWDVQSGLFRPTYPPEQLHLSRIQEPQMRPRLSQTTPTESSATWAGGPRQGACMVLSPMAYSSAPSVESLMGTGHSYASSLLNLLHSDRPDLNTVMVASSKQEFIPGWTRHMEFRDQAAPDHSCDSGVPMPEKTDLYWY